MANALEEAPRAAPLPSESNARVVLNGNMRPSKDKDGKIWARATALVQATPQDLYSLWRNHDLAPQWQEMIADVIQTGPRSSHWVMKTDGKTIEWDSEILADDPGRRIAWRSVGGDLDNAGEVVFEPAPGGRGTIVILLQEFRMSKAAVAADTLFSRNPKQAVIEILRHFKAFAETGETPRTEGQPHGPRGASGTLKGDLYGKTIDAPSAASGRR